MPYEIETEIIDEKGALAQMKYYVPTGLTLAQYETAHNTLITNVKAFILGGVLRSKICIEVPIGTIDQSTKPTANSDVEEVGEFIFETDAGMKTQFNLPAYDEGDTLPASDAIDQAAASPAALISAFITGVTLDDTVTVVSPVDVGGDDIESLVSARERYRNSGRRRR